MKTIKTIKVLWFLWAAAVLVLGLLKPFGLGIFVYFCLCMFSFSILWSAWGERIRRLIVEEYPDVLEKHPMFKKREMGGQIWRIKADTGDKRLRNEIKQFYSLGFFSFVLVFISIIMFFLHH